MKSSSKDNTGSVGEKMLINESDLTEWDRLTPYLEKTHDAKIVVVVGLGFVGAAMIAAVLSANKDEKINYKVIGVDLNDDRNRWKILEVQSGRPPIETTDQSISQLYEIGWATKTLTATWLHGVYKVADLVIIDVNLDITKTSLDDSFCYDFGFDPLEKAIRPIASRIPPESLVIVETTVPPGTTEKFIKPIFEQEFENRLISGKVPKLVHSFERVMPGENYLNSITNYFRVVSGIDEDSTALAVDFFGSFVNTVDFPLTILSTPTASEMTKVLENAYRATNIAFIQEWTEFAQAAKIDLFECLTAIRKRDTHNNIMNPGFGVGGYCLTKDAMLGDWALQNLFGSTRRLEMSLSAININDSMPDHCFDLLRANFQGQQIGRVALFGVSYLAGVADIRSTPAKRFLAACTRHEIPTWCHDPLVQDWNYAEGRFSSRLTDLPQDTEAVVFAVKHEEYLQLDLKRILSLAPKLCLVIDANNILDEQKKEYLETRGIRVAGIGKGHWSIE
jgi:UDP-N-acetyl-D-glucosamine dehydrogenase